MPDNRTYPMTREKLEELRAELKHKLEVEKPALAARLKVAIEMGDLSENAEYHSAKEDQSFLQGRIDELEEMIRGHTIITKAEGGIVQLGSQVVVVEEGEDEPETYYMVGRVEADPRNGKISDESPIGLALMGRKSGDRVVVKAPDGNLTFKIIEVL